MTIGWVTNRLIGLVVGATAVLAVGCGGGGSIGSVGGTPSAPESSAGRYGAATARFHVDVSSGQVTVTPLNPAAAGRAVFTGTAILFRTDTLVDQPGNLGRKVLRVALINRSGEPIGITPAGIATGVRVIFGDFVNVSGFSDLRQRTNVGTVAGTGTLGSADGATTVATLANPSGVAVDLAGNIYIADRVGHQVRKVAAGFVSTLAGSGAIGSANGFGATASFHGPMGIAYNPADNSLVVTEFDGNRVRRVTLDGRVTLIAGTGTAGNADGPGNIAQFRRPVGVAVALDGTIYVAESEGHRIRKIVRVGDDPADPSSYSVTTFAGAGVAGFADGPGTAARFSAPRGVAVAPDGTLYVADEGNRRIRRVSPTGEVVTIAGSGAAGTTDGSGESARFNAPFGIVWVNGALIVSDHASHVLRQVRLKEASAAEGRPNSWVVQTLAGAAGVTGSSDGSGVDARFNVPRLLAADASGNIYIADTANNRVRRLSPSSGYFPIGVVTGSASGEKVRLWNADGYFPNPLGEPIPYLDYPGALPEGASSEAREWVFVVPSGVTAFEFTVTVEANTLGSPPEAGEGGSPNVWVRTLYWSETAGQPVGDLGNGVDGTLLQAKFGLITDIEADRFGNLYVVDTYNNAVRRITPDGRVTTVAGGHRDAGSQDGAGDQARFGNIQSLAVSPSGTEIFVADAGNHSVRRIALNPGGDPTNPADWTVSTIAGSTLGFQNGLGNLARFAAPTGIAMDRGGNLYVTETSGNRVRVVLYRGGDRSQARSWEVRSVAGATDGSPGDVDGIGASARFDQPSAITVDPFGNLFVVELQKRRIRRITNSLASEPSRPFGSGVVTTVANIAGSVATDSVGYLYVASDRRVYRLSPGGGLSVVAGTGAAGFADGRGNQATFQNPSAMAIDPSGNLYLCDYEGRNDPPFVANLRIRLIQRLVQAGTP